MSLIIWLMPFLSLISCAAPSDVSSVDSVNVTSENSTPEASATAVNYGGAALGSEASRANAQSCIDSGKFYDRIAKPRPNCTVAQLAKIDCREDSLKQSLTPDRRIQFEKIRNSKMSGYVVDQCIDCKEASSRKTCKDSTGTTNAKNGTLVTFVKESGPTEDVRVIYIPK
jgi:hypothetical protein